VVLDFFRFDYNSLMLNIDECSIELPVVDAHVHVFPARRLAGLLRWVHGFLPWHPAPLDMTGDDVVADISNFGSKYFFNLVYPINPLETEDLNRFNSEFCSRFPNAIGWGSLHPENDDISSIARSVVEELGLIGLKLHPFVQKFSILDPAIRPAYETLADMRRPLFLHTGFDEFYEIKMPTEHIRTIAGDYPEMPIVLSHMIFPRLDDAFELMEEYPQIVGDMTNIPGSIRIIASDFGSGGIAESAAANLLRKELPRFSDRIIFGSDHPAGIGGVDGIYSDLAAIKLQPEIVRAATWTNPLKLAEKYLPGRWRPQIQPQ